MYELKIQGAYLSTNNCSEMHFCSKSDTHMHIIDYKVFLIVLILIKLLLQCVLLSLKCTLLI
jgi:hypothetical protein